MAYLDLAEADQLAAESWLLSRRRWGLFSWRPQDHPVDGAICQSSNELADQVRALARRVAGRDFAGPLRLLTQLRQVGVYFSPLNLFFLFDEAGQKVQAIVAEVSNTPWNERRCYVLHEANAQNLQPGAVDSPPRLRFCHDKDFHVSPFMPLERRYHWTVTPPGQRASVRIRSSGGAAPFDAVMTLHRQRWNETALAKLAVRHPAAAVQTLAAIYWQAWRLWRKGCPFYSHPRTLEPHHSRSLEAQA